MKQITSLAVAALLLGTVAGYAGPKGASEFTPGDRMHDTGGVKGRGASEFAPGDQMKDLNKKPSRGASEFSPGDRMNDRRGR